MPFSTPILRISSTIMGVTICTNQSVFEKMWSRLSTLKLNIEIVTQNTSTIKKLFKSSKKFLKHEIFDLRSLKRLKDLYL